MTSRPPKWVEEHPVLTFYVMAFAISWAGYLLGLAYTYDLFPFQSALFFAVGGVGPAFWEKEWMSRRSSPTRPL
ncbi:hypothetical protein [Palaeococcus ferrophilus]|uniref:hypothetical protein n=1 Tax=Palaeococcus ferrophilus TaxID=83868 RepID=UPI00064F823F|nr:hypothetical protein [Palaeococcus ferrophilus]